MQTSKILLQLIYISLFSANSAQRNIHLEIPSNPWGIIGPDMFYCIKGNIFALVDYHSKFPVIKKTESLTSDFRCMDYPRTLCQMQVVISFQKTSEYFAKA